MAARRSCPALLRAARVDPRRKFPPVRPYASDRPSSGVGAGGGIDSKEKFGNFDEKFGDLVERARRPDPEKAEAWQEWINYDSPYKDEDDCFNRLRHYFYYVDNKGRVYRSRMYKKEWRMDGEIRYAKFKDRFFSNLKRNTEYNEYLPHYPFVSINLYDRYFTRFVCSPIVFTDLDITRNMLKYGESLTVPFEMKTEKYKEEINGVLSSTVMESIAEEIVVGEDNSMSISWASENPISIPVEDHVLP
ncbi:hypothetical protein AAMO2058_001243100 [Amorphochlora amoebiformis]